MTKWLKEPWLDRQLWNQTFEDDIEVNIEEIWRLLDLNEYCGEHEVRQLLDNLKKRS